MDIAFSELVKQIEARKARIEERIRENAAGRQVTVIAVAKYVSVKEQLACLCAGLANVAESDLDQFVSRRESIAGFLGGGGGIESLDGVRFDEVRSLGTTVPRWHFIGRLHRSHANKAVGKADLIHSVHSEELATRIERVAAAGAGLVQDILVQINVSGEDRKQGMSPVETREAFEELLKLEHIRIRGLMTMAPFTADKKVQNATFRGLSELRDELEKSGVKLPVLSMGMSNDFEEAVKCGATHVRIGSALFSDE